MITADINVAPLVAKLRKLGLATRKPMEQLVREQARLFVSSSGNVPGMVQVTPPFGGGAKGSSAKKQGEARVNSDIRKVYLTPGKAFDILKSKNERMARGFWRAISQGDLPSAQAILRGSGTEIAGLSIRAFDDGSLHDASRNRSTGRVASRRPRLLVEKARDLTRYIREKQRNVGTLASGFNSAAQQLGAKGVPAWVTRHGTRFSGFTVQAGPSSFYILIRDGVPFAQADTVRRMAYVLRYRSSALDRQMPHIIRRLVQTAGFAAVTA